MGEEMTGFYDSHVHNDYFPHWAERPVPERYRRITRIIQYIRPSPIRSALEIGSESPAIPTFWSHELGLSPDECTVIDVSTRVTDVIKKSGFRVITRDISREPLDNSLKGIDLVLMCEVLEHLIDPDYAIRAIRGALAQDGMLILTTPNLASWANRLQLLLGFQPLSTETGTEFVFGRGPWMKVTRPVGHLQLFTLRSLTEFLNYHGLKIIHVEGLPFGEEAVPRMVLKGLDRVMSRLPSLASGLLVVASPQTDQPRHE